MVALSATDYLTEHTMADIQDEARRFGVDYSVVEGIYMSIVKRTASSDLVRQFALPLLRNELSRMRYQQDFI